MNTHFALTAIRKPLTGMVIAGTMLAAATGIAGAEPTQKGPEPSGSTGTTHVTVNYDSNGYAQYDYNYEPAPQPDPNANGDNKLGSGGTEQAWVRVLLPDGHWIVCRSNVTVCQ